MTSPNVPEFNFVTVRSARGGSDALASVPKAVSNWCLRFKSSACIGGALCYTMTSSGVVGFSLVSLRSARGGRDALASVPKNVTN